MTTSKPAAKPAAKPTPVDHPTLAHALAAFQAECPPIRKGNTAKVPTKSGGSYSYDYADLSDVIEVVSPVLGKHGLSFLSTPTLTKRGFGLKYRLMHLSGEKVTGFYPLPDPSRVAPQEMGSLLTYDRRYVLCAILGVAPGGDDNEERLPNVAAARQPERPQPARRAPQARPAAPAQPAAPARNFAAEASEAAGDHVRLSVLWQEARAAQEPVEVLDAIAALGRAAAAAAEAETATDPGDPDVDAPAAAPADAEATS